MIVSREGKIAFSRMQRRLLVSAAGTCYLLGIGALLLWFYRGTPWVVWAGGFGITIGWSSVWLLRYWTGSITERHEAYVDEREQALRNAAYRLAYRGLGGVMAVWYMYFQFNGPQWMARSHYSIQWASVLVFGILYHALPAAMIAWLAPDPPREGE